jgi:hypothetical protein
MARKRSKTKQTQAPRASKRPKSPKTAVSAVPRRFVRETIEELELAYQRLNAIFMEAELAGDRLTALNAQKELNRLGGLYRAPQIDVDLASVDELAAVVESYLHPLKLLPASAPPAEWIRIAAQVIIDHTDS